MRPAAILRRILCGEVDSLDQGTDHLVAMRERAAELEAQALELRALADGRSPLLDAAIRRRLRAMK